MSQSTQSNDVIQVTDSAVRAIRQALIDEAHPAGAFLRVSVKGGGCSGLSYDLSFTTAARDDDHVIEREEVKIAIDPKSALVLAGTALDYTSGLNGKGFVFQNPNATGTCGCGSSFSV